MVAYSFQARFQLPIVNRTKRQTIRGYRKGQAKVGSTLQLYFGMRTKYCRLIGYAECRVVRPIVIRPRGGELFWPQDLEGTNDEAELDAFARIDGFTDWKDLAAFWVEHHPGVAEFEGQQIFWGDTFTLPAEV